MSMDMNSLVSLCQGIPCTIRNLFPRVVLEESCAASCIHPEKFSLSRKLTLAFDIPAFARITCNGHCINGHSVPPFAEWTGCNEIVVILSMMPTLFRPYICPVYNVQDSALFCRRFEKSLLMLTKAAYPFFFDAPLVYRRGGIQRGQREQVEPGDRELSDPSDLLMSRHNLK